MTHCRRLCKTTKIFVKIENVFFLLNIHTNTSCLYIRIVYINVTLNNALTLKITV